MWKSESTLAFSQISRPFASVSTSELLSFNRKLKGRNLDFDDLGTLMQFVERLFKFDNSEVEFSVNFD